MCGIAGRFHPHALLLEPVWHMRAATLLAHLRLRDLRSAAASAVPRARPYRSVFPWVGSPVILASRDLEATKPTLSRLVLERFATHTAPAR